MKGYVKIITGCLFLSIAPVGCNCNCGPGPEIIDYTPSFVLQLSPPTDIKQLDNITLSIPKMGEELWFFDNSYPSLKFVEPYSAQAKDSLERVESAKKLITDGRLLNADRKVKIETSQNKYFDIIPKGVWMEGFESFFKIEIAREGKPIFKIVCGFDMQNRQKGLSPLIKS